MAIEVQFQCFGVQCKRCEQWIALVNLDGMDPNEIEVLQVPLSSIICPQCFHKRKYPADAGKLLLGLPERWGQMCDQDESDLLSPETKFVTPTFKSSTNTLSSGRRPKGGQNAGYRRASIRGMEAHS